jgi:hypothetical protein
MRRFGLTLVLLEINANRCVIEQGENSDSGTEEVRRTLSSSL